VTTGESAWKWNSVRKEFYLHQFSEDEPDFNFRNKDIVNYFEVLLHFFKCYSQFFNCM